MVKLLSLNQMERQTAKGRQLAFTQLQFNNYQCLLFSFQRA